MNLYSGPNEKNMQIEQDLEETHYFLWKGEKNRRYLKWSRNQIKNITN